MSHDQSSRITINHHESPSIITNHHKSSLTNHQSSSTINYPSFSSKIFAIFPDSLASKRASRSSPCTCCSRFSAAILPVVPQLGGLMEQEGLNAAMRLNQYTWIAFNMSSIIKIKDSLVSTAPMGQDNSLESKSTTFWRPGMVPLGTPISS